MRTLYPILVVVALGTATLIWGISGFGDIYGQDDPIEGSNAGDQLRQQADDSAASDNGSFNASARSGTENDNIVGVILSGISFIVSFATMVALLPLELMNLGFPAYFAAPVGLLAQAIVGVGIVQFATNRYYR